MAVKVQSLFFIFGARSPYQDWFCFRTRFFGHAMIIRKLNSFDILFSHILYNLLFLFNFLGLFASYHLLLNQRRSQNPDKRLGWRFMRIESSGFWLEKKVFIWKFFRTAIFRETSNNHTIFFHKVSLVLILILNLKIYLLHCTITF